LDEGRDFTNSSIQRLSSRLHKSQFHLNFLTELAISSLRVARDFLSLHVARDFLSLRVARDTTKNDSGAHRRDPRLRDSQSRLEKGHHSRDLPGDARGSIYSSVKPIARHASAIVRLIRRQLTTLETHATRASARHNQKHTRSGS
jgi:hypothetical protein